MAIETFVAPDFNPDFGNWAPPGKYHARIIEVDEEGGNKGEMVVWFEILDGTPGGMEGTEHRTYFAKTPAAMSRIHQFAMCLKMVTKEQLKDAKEKGKSLSYDFAAQVDKQLFIHLERDEYEGKERAKLGFGFFPIDSKQCVSWAVCEPAIRAAGLVIPARQIPAAANSGGAGKAKASPLPTTPASGQQAGAGGPVNVDDLPF